jgi:hypothetical protein
MRPNKTKGRIERGAEVAAGTLSGTRESRLGSRYRRLTL